MTQKIWFSPQLDQELMKDVKNSVRRGDSEELIIDFLEDFIMDSEDVPENIEKEFIASQIKDMINIGRQECLEEQKSWPAQTDCDRLTKVFKELSANGIVAKEDFSCCGTCGASEIGEYAKEGDYGYVFYHNQDTDGALETGTLYLGYGRIGMIGKSNKEIAQEVVIQLRKEGFDVKWNGSTSQRILIDNIDWKKRIIA